MDALTLLRNDHRTVEQLFKRFEKAGDRALVEKRTVVDRIIEELSIHAAIEEQVFYPAIRGTVSKAEDMVLESLEEHHVVKWLLSELTEMDPTNERFTAKVTVLIENVRHHVEEEEQDLFRMVRDVLGSRQLAELGNALEEAKRSAPTRPHPRAADTPPGNMVAGAIAGVADRIGDNLSGIAQGGVSAVQDLIARLRGADRPEVTPTGTTAARARAKNVRSAATTATDAVADTARSARSAVAKTAKTARSGARGTASTAASSARSTASATKRAATTQRAASTQRTSKPTSKPTATSAAKPTNKPTGKRAPAKKAAAATKRATSTSRS